MTENEFLFFTTYVSIIAALRDF